MEQIIITRLAEMVPGDTPTALNGRRYHHSLVALGSLGPIGLNSPAYGARFASSAGRDLEWVLCPDQLDGHEMTIERVDS